MLRKKVHLLQDVSDAQLASFYEGCLFTIYNSFYEGWGLPVTESFAFGKIVVTPSHSSLIEAGRGGAVFFEPGGEELAKYEPAQASRSEHLYSGAGLLPPGEQATVEEPASGRSSRLLASPAITAALSPRRGARA